MQHNVGRDSSSTGSSNGLPFQRIVRSSLVLLPYSPQPFSFLLASTCPTALQTNDVSLHSSSSPCADSAQAELVAGVFREKLTGFDHDPRTDCVFITSGTAAEWLRAATRVARATNRATAYLTTLQIVELSKSKKDGQPGWRWRGEAADACASMRRLSRKPQTRNSIPHLATSGLSLRRGFA